jgi:DNA polymerase-4
VVAYGDHEGSSARVLHVRCRPGTDAAAYRALLALVADVSPVVQPLPPSALLVDVAGALRYWGAGPYDLAHRIALRALLHLDVDVRIGAGPTWTVAAMASKMPEPVTVVPAPGVRDFLGPLPVGMLHGIGPVQAGRLSDGRARGEDRFWISLSSLNPIS